MKAFKEANVFIDGKIIKTNLTFDNLITDIGRVDADAEILPLPQDAVVVPGFIDIHMHGAGGADVMDGSAEALATIAQTVAEEGTTSFLATTMTQSEDKIIAALKAIRQYSSLPHLSGAKPEGVHLEGPFICPFYKGAQNEKYILKPDIDAFERFNEASGNMIKIVTLAPEADDAEKFIKYLKSKNIVPSIGHTAANERDVVRAIESGASHVTHTFNAQTPFHHREIGVAGSALIYDELDCEIIADLIHVSKSALKLLFKTKKKTSIILITDAIRAKGLSDGTSELGGQTVYIKNGEARLADGTLAGSVLKMNCAIKNIVEKVGVDFATAIDCATINPAKAIGIDKQKGSIERGKCADFAVLSPQFEVLYTIRTGKIIFKAK